MKEPNSLFIINPNAGRGRTKKRISQIKKILKAQSFHGKILITKTMRQAVDLAKEYADLGFEQIIAIGGDGTFHEIANGVMQSDNKNKVNLGLIPLGGGNDFARYFGFGDDLEENILRIKRNKAIKIDAGKIEDYYFVNGLGMGFDAVVAQKSQKIKFANGLFRYLIAVFQTIKIFKGINVMISIRNFDTEKSVTLISIGNTNRSGGGFHLTPDANPSDGLFDILVADKMNKWNLLKLLPKVINGKHLNNENVALIKSDHITVLSEMPIPVYLDGEIPILKNPKEIKINIIPKALNFIT